MHKHLLMFALLAFYALGLTACAYLPERPPEKVELSDGLKKSMAQYSVKIAMLVDEDGKIIPTDNQGKVLTRCSVKTGEKEGRQLCRGIQKGAVIEDVKSIVLIRSKINPTCWTSPGPGNLAFEYCWD